MGYTFLFYCAAMGYHFAFLPLLDAKVAQSLPYLHLSFLAFFNTTGTQSLTLALFCLGMCLREKMVAIALLSAMGGLRTCFIQEDLMRQEVFISPGHFHDMNYEYHGNVAIAHLRTYYCIRPTSGEEGEGRSYSVLNYMKKQSGFSA